MDVFSKEKRSQIMARIRNRGNKTTEWAIRSRLIKKGIKGWRCHFKDIPGNPDFSFPDLFIAIFLDGCYWHGCPKCKKIPATHKKFWREKISKNVLRDKRNSRNLKKIGWRVIRFWEHEIKKVPEECLKKIIKAINSKRV